jgi:hypothetical protein
MHPNVFLVYMAQSGGAPAQSPLRGVAWTESPPRKPSLVPVPGGLAAPHKEGARPWTSSPAT